METKAKKWSNQSQLLFLPEPANKSVQNIFSSHQVIFLLCARASKVEKSSCEVRDSNAVAIQPT
jgi:hypothetical protein